MRTDPTRISPRTDPRQLLRTVVVAAALCAGASAGRAAPPLAPADGQPPREASAQQSPPGGQAGPEGRGPRGGGARRPDAAPLALDDYTGFEPIFDGRSMKGWDGDSSFWRVENGAIVGESTPEHPVEENTFLIWRGGQPTDFELKAEYRLSATNSGIQIRSAQVPAGADVGKWVLRGYQADIDVENEYTGMIYEERGRGFLARRGQAVYVPAGEDARPRIIGNLEQRADELQRIIKTGDWNHVHIIARGNMIVQILNGHVTSVLVDDDEANRSLGGLIGFQMHRGDPMKVEFRNIYLKKHAVP